MGRKLGRIEGADAKFQAGPQDFDRMLGAASSNHLTANEVGGIGGKKVH